MQTAWVLRAKIEIETKNPKSFEDVTHGSPLSKEPVGLAELVEVLAAVHVLVGVLGRAVDVGADVGALAPRLRVHVVRLVVLEAGVHAGRLVEQSGRKAGKNVKLNS